jgi:hypothetical protein
MQGDMGINQSESHLAMLGHEMRNTLNGILGVTELLGNSELEGEQRQLLKALQQSGRQLRWLIESVNPAGQNAEFPFTPLPGELNGIDLLEQAVRCHTPAAVRNDNLLLLTVEPGLPAWWCSDGRLLRQVIDNLLGNAIKFTRSGLIIIEARRPPGEHEADSGLELLVRDSGPGISMAASRQIFEPWVQLENSRLHGGSGLGLHVCRRIVSGLHGLIDYSRNSSVGSCFRVYLPDVIDCQLNRKPGQVSGLLSSVQCQISVRDGLRRSLETLLARLGIRTVSCGKVAGSESGTDVHILINELEVSPGNTVKPSGLRFTHQIVSSHGGHLLQSRQLQAPYLESTLGPLLMEMALERRISVQDAGAIFDSNEKQG